MTGNKTKWVSVSTNDGMIYEGTVESEASYGIYLHLDGNKKKLILITWDSVEEIIRKS